MVLWRRANLLAPQAAGSGAGGVGPRTLRTMMMILVYNGTRAGGGLRRGGQQLQRQRQRRQQEHQRALGEAALPIQLESNIVGGKRTAPLAVKYDGRNCSRSPPRQRQRLSDSLEPKKCGSASKEGRSRRSSGSGSGVQREKRSSWERRDSGRRDAFAFNDHHHSTRPRQADNGLWWSVLIFQRSDFLLQVIAFP